MIKLLAIDNPGGKGVNYSVYSLDGEHWNEYKTPLGFADEGLHKISFPSHDNVDNTEELKTVDFSIDKTIPEAKIEVDQASWDLKVSIASGSGEVIRTEGSNSKAVYTLKDPAGNTLVLDTYDLDSQDIDIFKLFSLKYDSAPPISVAENVLDTNYIFYTPKKRPEIKVINQNFNLKDKATFVIVADATKNKTSLNIIENKKLRKEEKPGVALLKLQTNKGKLKYSY